MINKLRSSRLVIPLRSYDVIRDIPVETSRECAEKALAGLPYSLKEMEFFPDQPIDWLAEGQSRSYRMYIQSWNFLEPLFVNYSETGTEKVFNLLQKQIDSWLECFSNPAYIELDIAAAAETLNDEGRFIGHSMAIAGRFYRLSYFIDVSLRIGQISSALIEAYISSLRWHALFLSQDSNFPANHNHGVHVALAQIAGACRYINSNESPELRESGLDMEEFYCQGRRRLQKLLSTHVAADGIHKEHSPHYHMDVLHAIHEAIRTGLLTDPRINDIFKRMADAASWMFDNRGRLANFGDTDLELLPAGAEIYRDKLIFKQPQQRLFKQGGYWFVKGENSTGSLYLAHAVAFHSRTHKHADTGTFIWQDRGQDILIDAGRFGYVGRTKVGTDLFNDGFWYDDPRRVYVESTRAHNTLGINGNNHARFRGNPFGSAITASVEQNGIFACESSISGFSGMSHFRILVYKPGQWLMCIDTTRSTDDKTHDIRQYFHIHPDWSLEKKDPHHILFKSKDKAALYVTTVFDDTEIIDIAYGRGSPEQDNAADLFGWWSPRHLHIEPCNSFAIGGNGRHVTMATLFSFSEAIIDKSYTTFNVTRRRLRFRWKYGGDVETIIIDRNKNDGSKLSLTQL